METTPPFPVVSGQRQLAVIMFTDAVGFSARMHEAEVATLNRIERDSQAMRRLADAHSGAVLKSTGDGLLIQFSSAVQAVACALEIQRLFAAPLDPTHARTALRYRIGIHLGDVFVSEGDVMGDGVNIAARLVNEALPGGIVISHMVYDVVKNKLPLNILRVGPQQLKNIKEPITLYRVLLEEPRLTPPVAPPAATSVPKPAEPIPAPAPRRSSRRLVFGLLVVLGLAALGRYLLQEHLAYEEKLSRSQSEQEKLTKAMHEQEGKSQADTAPASTPSSRYDFAGRTTRIPAAQNPAEDAEIIRAARETQEPLLRWLMDALEQYTKARPLTISGTGDPLVQDSRLFVDRNHELNFVKGGTTLRKSWTELKPAAQAMILASALRDSVRAVPHDVNEGAAAFAYLHGLPDLARELKP